MQSFDIAIIGGGMVGLSLVHALCKYNQKLSCVIVDNTPIEDLYKSSTDNRGIALSNTTVKILQQLNIWKNLSIENKISKINIIHTSEQNKFGFLKISAAKLGLEYLGFVVSASSLGKALSTNLNNYKNLSCYRPELLRAMCLTEDKQSWILALGSKKKPKKITAQLVIGADGANSLVRKAQNIDAQITDHKQTAIVCNIDLKNLDSNLNLNLNIAFERFTKKGVLALLPFASNSNGESRFKCVWTVDNSNIQELMNLSDQEYLNIIQQYIGYRAGCLKKIDQRLSFPLKQVYAKSLYAQRSVLVGNAAHTLHPVAAQGFNLGIRDVAVLAEILTQAKRQNVDLGSSVLLKKYASLRTPDIEATCKFSNKILNIFESHAAITKISRQLGLIGCNFIPYLNNHIAKLGLGSTTKLPLLAKGIEL